MHYFDKNEQILTLKNNKIELVNKNTKGEFKDYLKTINKENLNKNTFSQFFKIDEKMYLDYVLDKLYEELKSIYIPAERILFSLIGDSMTGIMSSNVALPECYKEFASKFEIARKNSKSYIYKDFKIEYSFDNGNNFLSVNNNQLLLRDALQCISTMQIVFYNNSHFLFKIFFVILLYK